MKRTLAVFILGFLIFLTGCGNDPLSSSLDQDVKGQVEELKNNQNGLMADILTLQDRTEINARDIGTLQDGIMNNKNEGIQILQGDGPLILIFGLATIAMMLIFHYRSRAVKSEKAAKIVAETVMEKKDPELEDNLIKAAKHSSVEKEVYALFYKP